MSTSNVPVRYLHVQPTNNEPSESATINNTFPNTRHTFVLVDTTTRQHNHRNNQYIKAHTC